MNIAMKRNRAGGVGSGWGAEWRGDALVVLPRPSATLASPFSRRIFTANISGCDVLDAHRETD